MARSEPSLTLDCRDLFDGEALRWYRLDKTVEAEMGECRESKGSVLFAAFCGRNPRKREETAGASKVGCTGWLQRGVWQAGRGQSSEHQGDGVGRAARFRSGFPKKMTPAHDILLTDDQWYHLLAQLPKRYDDIDWGVAPVIKQAVTYFTVPVGTYFSTMVS